MALKIRCPHCRRTLLAEDETAGQEKLCPACGNPFTVPLPERGLLRQRQVAQKCPKCGADIAPGTEYCPHCYFDLAAGKRLPLGRRLRFVSVRTWMLIGLGPVIAAALAFVGIHAYRDRAQRAVGAAMGPTLPAPLQQSGAESVNRLFAAASAAERLQAIDQLMRLGSDALPALARALEESAADGGPQRRRNRAAAVELLARSGDARWLPALQKLRKDETVSRVVLRARALLGDEEVGAELTAVWLSCLRRKAFLQRVTRIAPSSLPAVNRTIVERTDRQTERCAEALRTLNESPDAAFIDGVLGAYWESWSWLGQQRGEGFAAEVFDLAKPPKSKNLEFRFRVRAARRALDRAAQHGSPAAQAAAGVVLAQQAPQYKSLRERIIGRLASILPTSEPVAQQRVCWTLARLTSRSFGQRSDRDDPVEFGRPAVEDTLRWARSSGLAKPGPLVTADARYPQPPRLVREVVTPRRQLERDLVRELRSGWGAVGDALDRWSEAGLGCTPRVERLLDPGQRSPSYPALAAAMLLVAERGEQRLRPQLELWQEASDQPPWVRGFAHTVLGVLDARGGRWTSGWPGGLDDEMLEHAGDEAPGWGLWGRLLAAGGPALRGRLEQTQTASLPERVRARLMQAAEQAERRHRTGP